MIKDDNYINIQGWMITKLDLKKTDLIVFSIIHGFSQDGKSICDCGYSYMASFANCTKRTVIQVVKSLHERELINVHNNGNGLVNELSVNVELIDKIKSGEKTSPVKKFHRSGEKISPVNGKNFTGSGEKTSPTIIKDNKTNNKTNIKEGLPKSDSELDKKEKGKEKKVPPKKEKSHMELAWEDWINYKRIQFKFKYKAEQFENIAKSNLWKLSGHNEGVAIEIINQSIGNGWQGFQPIKNRSKSISKQLITNQEERTVNAIIENM